jgi:catechol 2,3-dioxygenase-like lactoylglutathione lyase family enzyme
MFNPTFLILHVDSPETSAVFYTALLERPPVQQSPTFVLFAVSPALMLGLWSRHTVMPAAAGAVGGTEIAFTVDGKEAVDATHAAWHARGLPILQAPADMDFGRSFVAADPDGHRLRVFAPAREGAGQ